MIADLTSFARQVPNHCGSILLACGKLVSFHLSELDPESSTHSTRKHLDCEHGKAGKAGRLGDTDRRNFETFPRARIFAVRGG